MNESAIYNALWMTLGRLTERLEAATTPAEALAALAHNTDGLLPFTACALALPEPWRVWRATKIGRTEVTFNDSIPPEAAQTLSRFINMDRQLLIIDDLLIPPWSLTTHREVLWKDGTRSAMLVPLRAGGMTIGVLSFTSIEPNQYIATSHDLVMVLGWMVASALRLLANSEEISDQ